MQTGDASYSREDGVNEMTSLNLKLNQPGMTRNESMMSKYSLSPSASIASRLLDSHSAMGTLNTDCCTAIFAISYRGQACKLLFPTLQDITT